MVKSRLTSLREKRELRQALLLILLTIILLVGFVFWGLPAFANFVGNMFVKKSDPELLGSFEIRPTSPVFMDIPEATNSAELMIEGFAQPGVLVELFVNGQLSGRANVGESGTFVFESVELRDGENIIYGFAKSPNNNLESDKSKEYMVVFDTTKPNLVVVSPIDGAVFRREAERVVDISGSVDEDGTKVMVGDRMAIVSPDKTFSVGYQLVEGDQEIVIRAIDKAGNETEQTLKLRWEK